VRLSGAALGDESTLESGQVEAGVSLGGKAGRDYAAVVRVRRCCTGLWRLLLPYIPTIPCSLGPFSRLTDTA